MYIKDLQLYTDKSGVLDIPSYLFNNASRITKLGWALYFLHSNLNKQEDFNLVMKTANDIISYCEEYSLVNHTCELLSVRECSNGYIVSIIADIAYYGKPTKTVSCYGIEEIRDFYFKHLKGIDKFIYKNDKVYINK